MPTRSLGSSWSWPLLLGVLACEPKQAPVEPEPASVECPGVEQIDSLWTSSRRAELVAALEQLPGEWPQQLLASLDARVPEHALRWTDTYMRACERDSAAVMRCLEGRVWQLEALLTLIADDFERTPRLWSELERSLDDPRGCLANTDDGSPKLERARGLALASLSPLLALGELSEVERLLAELQADPQLTSMPSHALQVALARAATELAAGQLDDAETTIAHAAQLAEQLDPSARMAAAHASAKLAEARGDASAAERAHEQALAHAREQPDAWLLVTQLGELGRALIDLDQPARAVPPLVEAINLASRIGGTDNPTTAELQVILAEAQLELDQIEAAHDALTQARDAFVIALGPDHPQTLATVEAIGKLFVDAGRLGDAQFAYLDLLEIYSELYGVEHWQTAKIKLELADSLMAMDQHDSARTLYSEALVPLAKTFGAVHPDVVRASIHLGIAELALGNLDAAESHCSRGRDLASGLAADSPLNDEAARCLAQIEASRAAAKNQQTKKQR